MLVRKMALQFHGANTASLHPSPALTAYQTTEGDKVRIHGEAGVVLREYSTLMYEVMVLSDVVLVATHDMTTDTKEDPTP